MANETLNQGPAAEPSAEDKALSKTIQARIREDKCFFAEDFNQMRENMQFARLGAAKDWKERGDYIANLVYRHIKQSVAALYAKNPKAVARRQERLDFQIWDEDPQSMQMAVQTLMLAQQTMDPFVGMSPVVPQAAVEQAAGLMEDIQQGQEAKERAKKIGRTLEILFRYYQREQSPIDFKSSMKKVVRRALTNKVAYVEVAFQREYADTPDLSSSIADGRDQVQSIEALAYEVGSPEPSAQQDIDLFGSEVEATSEESKNRELEVSVDALSQQEYVLQREGLVFDFPLSTKVIPDKATKSLVGFEGGRWLTVEYDYSIAEVLQKFKVDLRGRAATYMNGHRVQGDNVDLFADDNDGDNPASEDARTVKVWKHFDKSKGVVYYLADGYEGFLRPPAAPDVFVEGFFPVFALTFNEVEDEDKLYPPSDVELLRPMQHDYNQSRQGKREHRQAARPRFVASKFAQLSDEDKALLTAAAPFTVTELNIDNETPIADVLQVIPMPGVDPNLYDTGETFQDVQLAVGSQEAQFGGVAKATATESSIAEGSRLSAVGLNADDMDDFLTRIARASGQVMLQEVSPETVYQIVGPGAFWPTLSLDEIAAEIALEIEAGSSGKPNTAAELQNWERMLPYLIQLPGINPIWLAREAIKRLDDRLDLTDAFIDSLPSIVMQNRGALGATGDPSADPNAQGDQGADNGPQAPGGPTGTLAPGGNNQV